MFLTVGVKAWSDQRLTASKQSGCQIVDILLSIWSVVRFGRKPLVLRSWSLWYLCRSLVSCLLPFLSPFENWLTSLSNIFSYCSQHFLCLNAGSSRVCTEKILLINRVTSRRNFLPNKCKIHLRTQGFAFVRNKPRRPGIKWLILVPRSHPPAGPLHEERVALGSHDWLAWY